MGVHKRMGEICGYFALDHNERQKYDVMETSMDDRIIFMYSCKIISANVSVYNKILDSCEKYSTGNILKDTIIIKLKKNFISSSCCAMCSAKNTLQNSE